jgi:hypothetical protein
MNEIWDPHRLANKGRQLNEALAADCALLAAKKDVGLANCVVYALLPIANNTKDSAKRDLMLAMLRGKKQIDVPALSVRRWAPVQKALPLYAPIVQRSDNPTLDEVVAQQVDKTEDLSWSSLMPDKLFAITHFAGLPAEEVNRLIMPFGKAVQKAYSYYSGVSISGQPTRTHHAQLHAFEKVWAKAAGVTVLEINSGLHEFGMQII